MTREETAEFERLVSCFTPRQHEAVERALCLRAYVVGWLGDPMEQPPRVILNTVRDVMRETSSPAN